jgi:hypothetical protein
MKTIINIHIIIPLVKFTIGSILIIATITNIISETLSKLAPNSLSFLLFLAINPSSISDIPQ